MRGKKGVETPHDPISSRRRANKQRGRGTFANDRAPILGTVGRESGAVRLEVVENTQSQTLQDHVHRFTLPGTRLNTDEYDSYNGVDRPRVSVSHGDNEWARDADGDGRREIHINTIEGLWTDLRNFLRPFRGVSKHYLSGYVAIEEFRINLSVISVAFITNLVCLHTSSS